MRRPDEQNAWDVLSKYAGTVEGPEDWSEEHDHYLYGVSKREKNISNMNANRFLLILLMHWRQTNIFNRQTSRHCCEKLDETIDYRKINEG